MTGRIFQLSTSPGGVPKVATHEGVVNNLGLEGDGHRFPNIHGGPERALCLYSLERILELQAEGHPIFPGSVGENVTISGLDWSELNPGIRIALGNEVIVEITSYTRPCNSIPSSFIDGEFQRIYQNLHPGYSRLYARVLQPGRIRVGQTVELLNGDSGTTPAPFQLTS